MKKILVLISREQDSGLTQKGQALLQDFRTSYALRFASMQETPGFVAELVTEFQKQGGQLVICVVAAGDPLAAQVSALCHLPILLVTLDEVSSMNSQTAGVPVAWMGAGEGGFQNAAMIALQILGGTDQTLAQDLYRYRQSLGALLLETDRKHRVMFDA